MSETKHEKFQYDLDNIWKRIYQSKQGAIKYLTANYIEGVDYTVLQALPAARNGTGRGGRRRLRYLVTREVWSDFETRALPMEPGTEPFVVSLDDNWERWGYARKDNCVRALKSSALTESVDFILIRSLRNGIKTDLQDQSPKTVSYWLTREAASAMVRRIETQAMKDEKNWIVENEGKLAEDKSREAMEYSGQVYRERLEKVPGAIMASWAMDKLAKENANLEVKNGILVKKNEVLAARNEELEPKGRAFDHFLSAENNRLLSDVAKDLGEGPIRFIRKLRELSILFRRDGVNFAYQRYIPQYFEHRTVPFTTPDGEQRNTTQVLVTPRGQSWLADMFRSESGELNIE